MICYSRHVKINKVNVCCCTERRAEWPSEEIPRGSVEGGPGSVHWGAWCKSCVFICFYWCFSTQHWHTCKVIIYVRAWCALKSSSRIVNNGFWKDFKTKLKRCVMYMSTTLMPLQTSESEYFIDLRGEIVFVTDAPCKVEIEIQHEWEQETKIKT